MIWMEFVQQPYDTSLVCPHIAFTLLAGRWFWKNLFEKRYGSTEENRLNLTPWCISAGSKLLIDTRSPKAKFSRYIGSDRVYIKSWGLMPVRQHKHSKIPLSRVVEKSVIWRGMSFLTFNLVTHTYDRNRAYTRISFVYKSERPTRPHCLKIVLNQ